MKITKYMGMALAIATLAACSNDEDLTSSWQNDPTAIKVNATVGSGIFTRSNPLGTDEATQKKFNEGDAISIAAETQNAVTYTLTNGIWTPETNEYLKWEKSKMAITAYYPVVEGASAQTFTLPTDQADNDKIVAADYMTYSGSQSKPTTGGELSLEMERQMARVIVKIAGFNDQFGTTPTIANVIIKSGAANYTAGAAAGNVTAVTPFAQNLNASVAQVGTTYTALVIPADAKASESFITMDVNGTALIVKGIPAMEAGKSYTYNLTIGKDAITVGEVTVTDWTTGTIAGGEAVLPSSANAETHSIELTRGGTLTNDLLATAIGNGNDIVINGSMSDADFVTMRDWAIANKGTYTLKTLDLSGVTGLTALPEHAFSVNDGSSVEELVSVTLPASVTMIGAYAFNYCTALKTINLGAVTGVGKCAFCSCTSLTGIDLGNVTAIGDMGFSSCTSLGIINAPKLQMLMSNVFRNCGTVSEINLPSVTGVDGNGSYSYRGDQALSIITVQSGGTINLPLCKCLGEGMFYNMSASGATLKLTAAGDIDMASRAFDSAFATVPNLVLNKDKMTGGSGSPCVKNGNNWGYIQGPYTTWYAGWINITYVDNEGNPVE